MFLYIKSKLRIGSVSYCGRNFCSLMKILYNNEKLYVKFYIILLIVKVVIHWATKKNHGN